MPAGDNEPQPLPIAGELDLHTFRPQEAAAVVEAFLEESQRRGWKEVRLIHGKGIGTLREVVHAYLRKSPRVHSFRQGDEQSGGWGATWVILKK